jgi:hypothetical protein
MGAGKLCALLLLCDWCVDPGVGTQWKISFQILTTMDTAFQGSGKEFKKDLY